MVLTERAPEAPTTAKRAKTRARLLDAAREVLIESSIYGASVEELCERAGFTRGAFYSNFASRDELILALFERERAQMFAHLQQAGDISSVDLDVTEPLAALSVLVDRFLNTRPMGAAWYLLQSEFAAQSVRHPEVAALYRDVWGSAREELGVLLESTFEALGRRVAVPVADLVSVLVGTFDLNTRDALTQGRSEIDRGAIMRTLPRILLALSEPVTS